MPLRLFLLGLGKIVKEIHLSYPLSLLLCPPHLAITLPAPPSPGSQISPSFLSECSFTEAGYLVWEQGTLEEELEVRVVLKRMKWELQYFKSAIRYAEVGGRNRSFLAPQIISGKMASCVTKHKIHWTATTRNLLAPSSYCLGFTGLEDQWLLLTALPGWLALPFPAVSDSMFTPDWGSYCYPPHTKKSEPSWADITKNLTITEGKWRLAS